MDPTVYNPIPKSLSVAGLLCVASWMAQAGVIFTTSTNPPGFFPSNGSTSTSSVYHAFQFTVGAGQGGTFDELITAGLANGVFSQTFSVFDDAAGSIGSLIDEVSITTVDGVSQLYTGTATNHVVLLDGFTYWLQADSPTGSNAILWLQDTGSSTTREFSSSTGYFNGQPFSAFALLQNDPAGVPEPGTWVLSLALLALVPARRLLRPVR
jgi:hypothetical protein